MISIFTRNVHGLCMTARALPR